MFASTLAWIEHSRYFRWLCFRIWRWHFGLIFEISNLD